MAEHEVHCFAHHLGCEPSDILTWDLLHDGPSDTQLNMADIVLVGGSGNHSVVTGGAWLEPALASMRRLVDLGKPTFASCWGCQAMAAATGGRVVRDPDRAEVGTVEVHLTPDGLDDPVLGPLGPVFGGQSGHEDLVDELPPGAVLLGSSDRTENQAFRFEGLPIYCTQFHPELSCDLLLDRLRRYPGYIRHITGLDYETFAARCCRETPETSTLLRRFMSQVASGFTRS